MNEVPLYGVVYRCVNHTKKGRSHKQGVLVNEDTHRPGVLR